MFGTQSAINTKPIMAVGEMFWYAGTTVPDKCLECGGSEISKTTYAKLFAVIGTLWDATDGAATPAAGNFRLPPSVVNGTNAFVSGKGSGDTVGDTVASAAKSHPHTGSAANAGNHRHSYGYTTTSGLATNSNQNKPCTSSTSCTVTKTSNSSGSHSHALTVSTDGSSVGRPTAALYKLCIYTG